MPRDCPLGERLWPPRPSPGLRGGVARRQGHLLLLEFCCLKEEREARFLHFLSVSERIGPKPQPAGLKIGLRKDFLSGEMEREVKIPLPQGFFGLEDPRSSQVSQVLGGKVVTIWLYPTQVEEKRESLSLTPLIL